MKACGATSGDVKVSSISRILTVPGSERTELVVVTAHSSSNSQLVLKQNKKPKRYTSCSPMTTHDVMNHPGRYPGWALKTISSVGNDIIKFDMIDPVTVSRGWLDVLCGYIDDTLFGAESWLSHSPGYSAAPFAPLNGLELLVTFAEIAYGETLHITDALQRPKHLKVYDKTKPLVLTGVSLGVSLSNNWVPGTILVEKILKTLCEFDDRLARPPNVVKKLTPDDTYTVTSVTSANTAPNLNVVSLLSSKTNKQVTCYQGAYSSPRWEFISRADSRDAHQRGAVFGGRVLEVLV